MRLKYCDYNGDDHHDHDERLRESMINEIQG